MKGQTQKKARVRLPAYIIDVRWLVKHGACYQRVEQFRQIFGYAGAPVTRANLIEAAEAGLPLEWLASRLCRKAERAAYDVEIRDLVTDRDDRNLQAAARYIRHVIGNAALEAEQQKNWKFYHQASARVYTRAIMAALPALKRQRLERRARSNR